MDFGTVAAVATAAVAAVAGVAGVAAVAALGGGGGGGGSGGGGSPAMAAPGVAAPGVAAPGVAAPAVAAPGVAAPLVVAPAIAAPGVAFGAVGAVITAAAGAATFAGAKSRNEYIAKMSIKTFHLHSTVGAGAASTILFTLDQIRGFENMPSCNEAGIESCAKVNLNFDAFDRSVNIFGTSLQRNLDSDLDVNIKFYEVITLLYLFLNSINSYTLFSGNRSIIFVTKS